VFRIEIAAPLRAAVAGKHLPGRVAGRAPRHAQYLAPTDVSLIVARNPVERRLAVVLVERAEEVLSAPSPHEAEGDAHELSRLVTGITDRQLRRAERVQSMVHDARQDRPVVRH